MDETGYRVLFHRRLSGKCPMEEFIQGIPPKAKNKLMKWIQKLEGRGPDLPRPYADMITGQIRELRMVFASQQYRCLYFFNGKTIVLTHGFVKKTDEVAPSEILKAQNLMKEYYSCQ